MGENCCSVAHVQLCVIPWTAACQASLSISNSQSLLKLMSIESVMPSNHLILCRPLLFPPSIFPSIRVFSNESVLHIRWSKYWNFSFSISPSSEYSGLISFGVPWKIIFLTVLFQESWDFGVSCCPLTQFLCISLWDLICGVKIAAPHPGIATSITL